MERYELTPGHAIAAETRGLMHAREPIKRGEQITLLAIALHLDEVVKLTGIFKQALNNLLNDLAFNKSQALVPTEMRVGQLVLIQTQLMQDRRVHVTEVVGLFDRM